ncbi:hypothetical protein VSP10_02280 [Myroides odoratimimus]|uniref:hypothetical protein n=1 Tax=Myroides odoratimimus TaxID=76832 RepID=UPI002DC04F5B|nr:hypothetical protein [Myroides odoratimimus]MEC4051608.1 hypothetical protein [Myroides odoratimimus]
MSTNEQPVKIKGDTSTIVEYGGENFKILKKESFNERTYNTKIETLYGLGDQEIKYDRVRHFDGITIGDYEKLKSEMGEVSKNIDINEDRYLSNIYLSENHGEGYSGFKSFDYGLLSDRIHLTMVANNTEDSNTMSSSIEIIANAFNGGSLKIDDKNVVRSVNGVLADESGELPLELNVLTSADGTKFKLMVSNEGFLGVQKIQ